MERWQTKILSQGETSPHLMADTETGLARMAAGEPLALLTSTYHLARTWRSRQMDLGSLQVNSQRFQGHSILLPRHSPLKPMLERGVSRLRESGSLAPLIAKWAEGMEVKVKAKGDGGSEAKELGMGSLVSAFAVYGLILGATLLFLLAERWHSNHHNNKRGLCKEGEN